jgi:hypothetical protein
MIPSEELELKLYRFAELTGKARWRPADVGTLSNFRQFTELSVLIDALHDLYARKFMEFRRSRYPQNGWSACDGSDREYFYVGFQMRVTFSGRKYFESLEAQEGEEDRVDRISVAGLLEKAEHGATLRELREAYSDLSKSPNPDLTGVVQHSMAALECTAKMIAGSTKGTLGDVLKKGTLKVPPSLSAMLSKAWGFASDHGRHVHDGKPVSYSEAELMLALAEAVIVYLRL